MGALGRSMKAAAAALSADYGGPPTPKQAFKDEPPGLRLFISASPSLHQVCSQALCAGSPDAQPSRTQTLQTSEQPESPLSQGPSTEGPSSTGTSARELHPEGLPSEGPYPEGTPQTMEMAELLKPPPDSASTHPETQTLAPDLRTATTSPSRASADTYAPRDSQGRSSTGLPRDGASPESAARQDGPCK